MAGISTHVLDVGEGAPASGVPVTLEYAAAGGWEHRGGGFTDDDGRIKAVTRDGPSLEAGTYRLTFDTAAYHRGRGVTGFYPSVTIEFDVADPDGHYHVPLLLSPYGYTTYRGS